LLVGNETSLNVKYNLSAIRFIRIRLLSYKILVCGRIQFTKNVVFVIRKFFFKPSILLHAIMR